MSTLVVSKKIFIDMLNRQIKDDDVIVFTNEMNGEAYAASKRNPFIRLPFAFSGEAFKVPNGLKAVLDNPCFAVSVLPRTELSVKAFNLITEVENKEIDSTFETINAQKV
jgi:hypothetical protein